MRAVGFFFAVFFSMLFVFLVATGEVHRWFSDPEENEIDWQIRQREESEIGKNMLDFEFWDVKEGRRRFIIRAELNQEALKGTDPLSELKTISLRSGVIELPLKEEKKNRSHNRLHNLTSQRGCATLTSRARSKGRDWTGSETVSWVAGRTG